MGRFLALVLLSACTSGLEPMPAREGDAEPPALDAGPSLVDAPVLSAPPDRTSLADPGILERAAMQMADPFTQRVADRLVSEISQETLERFGELDWEAADDRVFTLPEVQEVMWVVAYEIDVAYPPEGFPYVTAACADQMSELFPVIRGALRSLRDAGALGLALAWTCYGALVPGPQFLPAVGLCAAGLAILALASLPDLTEAVGGVQDQLSRLTSVCQASCGTRGEECCAHGEACFGTGYCDTSIGLCCGGVACELGDTTVSCGGDCTCVCVDATSLGECPNHEWSCS